MIINPGSEINKLLNIFFIKKTNFYTSKWGFSALKIPKFQKLQEGLAPLDPQQGHCPCTPSGACGPLKPRLQGGFVPLSPQQGRCPCTPTGTYGPLEPRLIYDVNSHKLSLSVFLVHPHFHPWLLHYTTSEILLYLILHFKLIFLINMQLNQK